MLPGFKIKDKAVASRLEFDVTRLESDEQLQNTESDRPPEYSVLPECHQAIQRVINEYFDRKPEIEEYTTPGSLFSMRVYPEDAEVVAKKLASEIIIEFTDPIEAFDHYPQEIEPQTYEEFVSQSYDISLDVDWNMLSDVHVDIQQAISNATPEGIQSPSFTRADYDEFLTEYVLDPVISSEWSGGHAWLINLAIRELRNGRYTSAAYGFEGARHGLTKRSHWEDNRFRHLMDSCLSSLRNLCMSHGEEGDPFGDIGLNCHLENRDLIFYPNFIDDPSFGEPFYEFSNKSWIANILILVQAVAHMMEDPTISRREVDPFGSNLTHRNITFILNLSQELVEQDELEQQNGEGGMGSRTLQMIDFEEYSPDISLTRLLDSHNYRIISYGTSDTYISGDIDIEYDLLVKQEDEKFVVRAGRFEDRDLDQIEGLISHSESSDWTLLLIFEEEIEEELVEIIGQSDSVVGFYADLVNERMRPISSGFPRRFESLNTEEEILSKIQELHQSAEDAETTEEKGDSLEELMELIFEKAIADTEVRDMNVRTRVEEIDLELHNKGRRYPWDELGTRIPVECKNWSDTAGVDVIYTLFGKAQMMSPRVKGGILVSWEGISDSVEGRNGDQLIREIRQKDINLLVLDKDDLEEITETGNVQSIFEEKADELWAR